MPDESSRERWDREDESEAARAHELELIKARGEQSPWTAWAVTVRVFSIWLVILAAVCYLATIDKL